MAYIKYTNIKVIAFSILLVGIFGYSYYQTKNIILGPVITVISPQNGSTLAESVITIKGNTKNISHITLNDRQIFVDEGGSFDEKLLLSPGYNIITIRAEDKFGRTTENVLELVYN